MERGYSFKVDKPEGRIKEVDVIHIDIRHLDVSVALVSEAVLSKQSWVVTEVTVGNIDGLQLNGWVSSDWDAGDFKDEIESEVELVQFKSIHEDFEAWNRGQTIDSLEGEDFLTPAVVHVLHYNIGQLQLDDVEERGDEL